MSEIRDHKDHPVTRSLTIIDPTRAPHGTATRNRYGCHCADCRTACRDDAKQRRRAATFTDPSATAILTLLSAGGTIRDVEQATGQLASDRRPRELGPAVANSLGRRPDGRPQPEPQPRHLHRIHPRSLSLPRMSSLPQTEDPRFSSESGRIRACPDPGEETAERPGSRKPGTGIAKRRVPPRRPTR